MLTRYFVRIAVVYLLFTIGSSGSFTVLAAEPILQIITVIEPPSSYLDSHGQLTGYATEQVRALQRQLQDRTQIQLMPESRALLTANRQPGVLLYGFSRTIDREPDYHWIMPLARKSWILYQRSTDPNPVRSLDEARALSSIGVVRGDIREEWLLAQGFTNLQASASHAQNLARLHSGRLDAIAFEPQGMQYLTREAGQSLSVYRPSLRFHSSEVWLLMSRQTPAAEVARWQQAAEQLQQNGTLATIASQWQLRLRHNEQIQCRLEGQLLTF